MLNVGKLENGIVLDHIQAGRGMLIYQALGLDQKDRYHSEREEQ